MKNRWLDDEALEYISRFGREWGDDLALRTYTSRLLGSESSLVLHGGGNTSVKTTARDLFGRELPVIFVKASGVDLATIQPEQHSGMNLEPLRRLEDLAELSDEMMVRELRRHLLDYRSPNPSIESLVHGFIPARFVDHTHADAILSLTNQPDGRRLVTEAVGDSLIVLDYVKPGFELARAMARAVRERPDSIGAVWLMHGVITWGESARESYSRMIEVVTRAEDFLTSRTRPQISASGAEVERARSLWIRVGPVVRGLLAGETGVQDRPFAPVVLMPLIDGPALGFMSRPDARELALTPPVTSDHLIRTKVHPLWIDQPECDRAVGFRRQVKEAIGKYRQDYEAYFSRYAGNLERGIGRLDTSPRVVFLPGVGIACSGPNESEARICRDITAQTLQIKSAAGSFGGYQGMAEADLFAMEYRGLQHAKLKGNRGSLEHQVALVTGAAGAIGAGICRRLLEAGCQVAAADISKERLQLLMEELSPSFGERVIPVEMDVTDPASVAAGFDNVILTWGGVDLVVVNAGVAHVAPLSELDLEAFRRLERVNTEGTLLLLGESARFFEKQGTGGDIVLISTKNVFAPGARFGAYSATKAAAHQLARIASQELAPLGVRVNMVAPDAIFGEGRFKSGLWAEVGPDRMRARGLDEGSLQEYYRARNLLKIRITADHVANAVLFFALRETPTTGATIPVDGGLPDSTPR